MWDSLGKFRTGKALFYHLFEPVFDFTLLVPNIKSVFEKYSIWPYNRDKVID